MLGRSAVAIICAISAAPTWVSAQPEPACSHDSAGLVAEFEKHGYAVIGDALTSRRTFLQILYHPATADFAMIESLEAGPGCVFQRGSGFVWIELPPESVDD